MPEQIKTAIPWNRRSASRVVSNPPGSGATANMGSLVNALISLWSLVTNTYGQ
jgi:hypothetical protein